MGALVVAGCLAVFAVLTPAIGVKRQERVIDTTTDAGLAQWRVMADTTWGDLVLVGWAVLSVAGGIFLLRDDHVIGWAWFAVGAAFVVAVPSARHYRSVLRTLLDDRDVPHLPDRQRSGNAMAYRFLALGTTGYLGMRIVEYAYPNDPPPGATSVIGLFGIVLLAGAVGFIAVRTWMYLRGHDLHPRD